MSASIAMNESTPSPEMINPREAYNCYLGTTRKADIEKQPTQSYRDTPTTSGSARESSHKHQSCTTTTSNRSR